MPMTTTKLMEAFEACRFHVDAYNDATDTNSPLKPVQLRDIGPFTYEDTLDDEPGLSRETLEHLVFMCEEGKRLVRADKREKAMRWLGFLQGVLWSHFNVPLGTLKDMNKPEFVPDEEGGHFIEGKKSE